MMDERMLRILTPKQVKIRELAMRAMFWAGELGDAEAVNDVKRAKGALMKTLKSLSEYTKIPTDRLFVAVSDTYGQQDHSLDWLRKLGVDMPKM